MKAGLWQSHGDGGSLVIVEPMDQVVPVVVIQVLVVPVMLVVTAVVCQGSGDGGWF